MSVFVNAIVSGRHQRAIGLLLWLAVTACLLVGAFLFGRHLLQDALRHEVAADLVQMDKLHNDLTSAFDALQAEATAAPCSDQFLRQLRGVAFRPDGLNEFIYAPDGMVTCSTSITQAQHALPLGEPDIGTKKSDGISYWIDKRLNYIGLPGMSGIVAHREPFAIVIPMQTFRANLSNAVKKEFVISSRGGRLWHMSGQRGVYRQATSESSAIENLLIAREIGCGKLHNYCVATEMNIASFVHTWRVDMLVAVLLIAFYAIWPATTLQRWLSQYWSLESRFRRHLNADSIVCAYQPILNLKTGEISGCEVLARWRDVDGTIIAPDQFIDIVTRSGQTLEFTQMVADRAFLELSTTLPPTTHLQVNFNIFPRDLDCQALQSVFGSFMRDPTRFRLALEIVESDALCVDRAEREIEALAQSGIRTYIDDFGSGYSSIHRLASLAIHGVKLDRSFAMAPGESLMARMLVHALDMVGSCDREIVVEGIETQERLDLMKQMQRVTYAQGYFISRPLSIERLAAFLAKPARPVAAPEERVAA
ncbi:EAL domain-containing protein [Hyphomicrobium sp. LHD-15]|uniref:EAL domain-containing protein n=1 Tax=Hyphomicrobium sp. LHD-15 TaxID=3072142 RepID=UPI00280DD8FB|nr:EAL domain-containing protein [Hyphomicrobium sp. LHD-15]MDQ8697929.1 EAL domain-containing protein [Hyphomicrobium sp. LHD-15]